MGTDTEFGRPSSWPGGPEQGPGRAAEAGRAPRYGDRHDVRYTDQERSTWNVQLSTFNGVTERADGGQDMGTDTMLWGQTRCYGDRHDVGPASLAAAHRYGDRHGVQYTDQERLTSNVQLSTFNGVTERAHSGPNLGTDTVFGRGARCIAILINQSYLGRFSGCEFGQLVTRVRPLEHNTG